MTVNIDSESQYFVTPRKHKHSATETSANNDVSDQVHLGYDPMKHHINTTTNMIYHKLPLSGKECIFFQTDRINSWTAQCDKSRSQAKVVKNILSVGSFEHKRVILKGVLK